MILITKTFNKLLEKIKSVWLDEIKWEINKHKSWLENFIEIWILRNRKVLKWYLLHKKVRILVLFQEKNGNYLPFYIVRKETKFWKNITKESLNELSIKLDNIFEDLDNNDYQIIES